MMLFPPSVVAHLDGRRVLAHRKNPGKYSLPPSDPLRSVVGESFFIDLVARAEGKWGSLLSGLPELHSPPFSVGSVLDIGCGLALMDVLLCRDFGVPVVHLIDGDGTGTPTDGFRLDTKAWADVSLGRQMVVANNVLPEPVTVHEYVAGKRGPEEQVDLVISLRAWGHHFPVVVYIDLVRRLLKRSGIVILDIRNGTDGIEVMTEAGFEVLRRISDSSIKCQRVAFRWGSGGTFVRGRE